MLPIDKTLKFYVRYNASIHPELLSNHTVWLWMDGKWANCGNKPTQAGAERKARKIAKRGHRQIQFVNSDYAGF